MPPRSIKPKSCECGCGGETRGGDFLPGHDQRLRARIEAQAGGLLALKRIVESALHIRIEADPARSMGDQIVSKVAQYPELTVQRTKSERYRVRRKDWAETGSLWVTPQTDFRQFQVKLTGHALATLGGRAILAFGNPVGEDEGHPMWLLEGNTLTQLMDLVTGQPGDRRS